jgi:hypothetical protein
MGRLPVLLTTAPLCLTATAPPAFAAEDPVPATHLRPPFIPDAISDSTRTARCPAFAAHSESRAT